MGLENWITWGVMLGLPLWLVAEEVVHRLGSALNARDETPGRAPCVRDRTRPHTRRRSLEGEERREGNEAAHADAVRSRLWWQSCTRAERGEIVRQPQRDAGPGSKVVMAPSGGAVGE